MARQQSTSRRGSCSGNTPAVARAPLREPGGG